MPEKTLPIEFLLSASSPWTRYRARVDLLGEEGSSERAEVLAHPLVKSLVAEAAKWPGNSKGDHKSGKDLLNKVAVLADFGVQAGDRGMEAFAERVLAHRTDDGRVQGFVVMPKKREGEWLFDVDGQDALLALVALGFGDEPRVRRAVEALIELALDGGGWVWPDAPSPLPCRRFAGGCPYPTTKILRILGRDARWRRSGAARDGAALLLGLWEQGERRYGFGFGARFEKLRYPFVWFDLLHVLDALSRFPPMWKDPRFAALLQVALDKADPEGRFTPESVWMEWKGQCFGAKKDPSPWLTLVIRSIAARGKAPRSSRR